MLRVAILGSTGSVGRQALDVIARHLDRFEVVALAARSDHERLSEQVASFRPRMAGLVEPPADWIGFQSTTQTLRGEEALLAPCSDPDVDAVLVSVVGYAGLKCVLTCIQHDKRILLATKEAMVAGGALLTERLKASKSVLLPVDSEHSAMFQSMQGAVSPVDRLILTASGGPFRKWDAERTARATVKEALAHPNWAMGAKITVDCASMMNKGLELIEARWLFDVPQERIDVIVHPESIIHSAVQWPDGSVIAQLGMPDMRVPIMYALAYPERLETGVKRIDWTALGAMHFEAADEQKFPCLRLAKQALAVGGGATVVLNAANEVAVDAFLKERILFGDIARIVEQSLETIHDAKAGSLEEIHHTDAQTRAFASTLLDG